MNPHSLEEINKEGQQIAKGDGVSNEMLAKLSPNDLKTVLTGYSVLGDMSHPQANLYVGSTAESMKMDSQNGLQWRKQIDAILNPGKK